MLVTSNPAAPAAISASASEFSQDVKFAYLMNSGAIYEFGLTIVNTAIKTNPVLAFFFGRKKKKQQQVSKIEIYPKAPVIREGQKINFTAVATDSRGRTVQGAEFTWLAAKGAKDMTIKGGQFESGAPGIYYVGAKTRGIIGTQRIVVREDAEFRAMKEIRREAAGGKKRQQLRKEVEDTVKAIKANRAKPLKNSTKMRKADKAKLKQWDDAQKPKRKAAREKRRQRSKAKAANLRGSTSDADDEEYVEETEASSDPRYIISPDKDLVDERFEQ